MEKQLREFKGHSGSKIFLMENENHLFVRKINNVERNIERLSHLYELGYAVPKIYSCTEDILDMEYVHGLDMRNYLKMSGVNEVFNFICTTIQSFAQNAKEKDYTETYLFKLEGFNQRHNLPFKTDELISVLPKKLPMSVYHGDMTLENILSTENGFYLIDAVRIEYDSYIFDIAKMRQDLECKWFLRNDNIKLDVKLKNLQDKILKTFPLAANDSLLILMLLRVLDRCKNNDDDYMFLTNHINRLWKNLS